jgi:hypothetical protein
MVIPRKTSNSSRPIPNDPEFHAQARSERALTAMPWALQHFGDKNVSISRRKEPYNLIRDRASPSGSKQVDRIGPLFSDGKPQPRRCFVDGGVDARGGQLGVSVAPCVRTQMKKANPKAGQSLTAPIWNVSSSGPHRGTTGGSSEEDVSTAPKEPETHARFPEAHEHTSGTRGAQAPSPPRP